MGTVWRAHDEMLDRDVAIKEVRLPERLTAGERRLLCRRLMGEARATAALCHPGVVAVHDVLVEDGRPWIVMEFLQARSLHQVIAEDGPLPPARAAAIGAEVLSVLRAAHQAGILHRDVKPSNVLVCDDGRILLTDFGLAVHTHQGREIADTLVAGLEGSPAYLSPERVRGEPSLPAADLWSLGATLYATVEGVPPFLRSHALASMVAVLLGEYAPPAHAGPLAPVITALLAADPADRPDADELARMLDQARSGGERPEPVAPKPQGTFPFGWLAGRRPRMGALVGVATLAAMVIVLGAWSSRWNSVGQSEAVALLPVSDGTAKTVSYREADGYTVEMPSSWRRTQGGDGVRWEDGDSGQALSITPAPGDALTGLKAAEARSTLGGDYPGYRRLRLEAAPDLAGDAAEWEFVWAGADGRRDGVHGLRSRAAGYEFAFSAPDSRWTPGQRLYDRILKTFRSEQGG